MGLGSAADGIGKAVGLIARLWQGQIDQHTVKVLTLELLLAHDHLCLRVGEGPGLILIQGDIAVVHHVHHEQEHVDQRDVVLGNAADELGVVPPLYGVGRVEKLHRLVVQLHQLRKLPRRELVGQLVAADGVGVGNGGDGVDLAVAFKIADETLFLAVIAAGDNHGDHRAGGEGLGDHFLGDLHLIELGRDQRIVAVDIGAEVGVVDRPRHQQHENRRDDGAGQIGEASDEGHLGHKVFVPRLLHQIAHEHQQARHHRKHGEQGEEDRLDEADGHIGAELKLHEHHGDQAADGGEARRADLRDGLGQRDDHRIAQVVGLVLLLEAVAVDDRIVQRQGQLEDRGDGVGDKGDLAQQEVGAEVHDRRRDEGQADDGYLRVGLGGKGQHHHDDHRDEGRDHADLLVDELRAHVAERGGDVCIVGSERRPHRVERREAGFIRLRVVEGDGIQGGGLVVVLGRVVKVDALHAVDRFQLFKKALRFLVGEVRDHELGRAVCDELLFHHIQPLLGRGVRGQVGGQVVFHFDPVAGEEGEGHEDPHQQEEQIPFIDDEGRELQHEAAAVFAVIFHAACFPLLTLLIHII